MALLFESATLDLLFVIAALAGYLYYLLKKRLNYFVQLGVPFVPPTSVFEYNIGGAFQKKSVGEVYDDLYKMLEGHKYGGFFHIASPSFLLRDPELILAVLKTNFSHFNDHGLPIDPEENFLEANLFMLSGPKWRALRRKLSPTFTSGKLKGMFGLIDDCVGELSAHLDGFTGRDFELKDLLARFTTDVIGSCAFGIDSQSIKDPNSKFRQMGRRVLDADLVQKVKLIFRFMAPRVLKILGISTEQKDVSYFFSSLIQQAFEHRKKTGETRNDLIDLLLQLKEKGSIDYDLDDREEVEADIQEPDSADIKLHFTDKLLTAQSFVFFVAGFETTASLISFAVYLLGKHQDVQEKARQEVRQIKLKYGEINYYAIKNMQYLNAIIQETLRLFPPITILPRVCTKDFVLYDGTLIKQGTRIVIPVYSLHRDPQFFENPDEFQPERFIRGDKIVPGTYMPFGDGPRVCIARRFALLEAGLVMAKLVDKYKVLPSEKMKEPLQLKNHSFVVVPEGGTWLRFEKLDE